MITVIDNNIISGIDLVIDQTIENIKDTSQRASNGIVAPPPEPIDIPGIEPR